MATTSSSVCVSCALSTGGCQAAAADLGLGDVEAAALGTAPDMNSMCVAPESHFELSIATGGVEGGTFHIGSAIGPESATGTAADR